MKKILIIYPGFPHYRKGIIDQLLASEKHEFHFIGDKDNYIKNIRPYTFDKQHTFTHAPSKKYRTFLFHKGLLQYVVQQKFDGAIVHSSPYWITIYLAVIILKLKGIRVYNWTHGLLEDKRNLKNYFYYFFQKTFSGLLLYGDYARQNLMAFGYPEEKMKVIYNSLDYFSQLPYRNSLTQSELREFREKMFNNPRNPQLVFIGRLTRQKKLFMLLEALKNLKHNNIIVNLLFVGDGAEKPMLLSQINDYDLGEQVHFFGPSYDEKTNYALLASSDCCVSPGEVGLTAIHSLMYGTPVISHADMNSQMPEVESIIPQFNGELFEKDNVEDLCSKIRDVILLGEKLGPELRKNCYQIVDEKFNPKYQLQIIEEVFP